MSCLKKTVGLFGFVIIAGGIFLIVWTSIKLAENSSDLFSFAGFDWGEALTIITLIIGCAMVILGIFGVYGGCKRNKCCLCVYTPAIFILSLILIAIAVMSTIVFVQYNNQLSEQVELYDKFCLGSNFAKNITECNTNYCGGINLGNSWTSLNWVNTLNNDVNMAGSLFGSTEDCQIYVSSDQPQLKQQILKYDLGSANPTFVTSDTKQGYINIQKCPNVGPEVNAVSTLMVLFEKNFKCSGMCQPYPYYIYTSVDNSPIQTGYGTPCFKKVVDFWNNYGIQIQAITYTGGSLLLINVILVLVLCCKKEKKEGNTIYTNMDYLD